MDPELRTLNSEPSPAGRPPVLDEPKRQKILALLALGSSRRMAARVARCAPSTITRTALRDAQFAEQLARAEQSVEIEALRALRKAAQNDRYWRAAAWLLERRNPVDFAFLEKPRMLTQDAAGQLFLSILLYVVGDMPEQKVREVMRRIDDAFLSIEEQARDERQNGTSTPQDEGVLQQPTPQSPNLCPRPVLAQTPSS
jgi:hypothetical protein